MSWPTDSDTKNCVDDWAHKASQRHTRSVCPVTLADEAEREGAEAFMRRYPGVL